MSVADLRHEGTLFDLFFVSFFIIVPFLLPRLVDLLFLFPTSGSRLGRENN